MTPGNAARGPVVETGMLIRRPVSEVFEAFVDPEITTRFWFTRSSGRLEEGNHVEWEWEMYSVSIPVKVERIQPNHEILIEWPGHAGPQSVQWRFSTPDQFTTFVKISTSGFAGDPDEVLEQCTDAKEGFTLVLAGLKALLEHGIELNLVGDRFPPGEGGQP